MSDIKERLNLNDKVVALGSVRDSDHELLKDYIAVCNRAIEANRDVFPYKEIFSALEQSDPEPVSVSVVDDRPKREYELSVEGGSGPCHIVCDSACNCADDGCDKHWRVAKSYLLEVVNNPQPYIQNPALIDWDWMLSGPES